MKAYVLFAQAVFVLIGGFFFITGAIGTFSWRPGFNSGPSPIIGVFIGLPLIAIAVLMSSLHTKAATIKDQGVLVRCPKCNGLNNDKAKFCNQCGNALYAYSEQAE